jgi:LmbE family N-acetylglucosaminyl deacetylase
MIHLQPEDWHKPQKILIILAHPDDPEFFCGGTIARWTEGGHEVVYSLITNGDKGTNGKLNINPRDLSIIRKEEQRNAAKVLGVDRISFLLYEDGYLIPDLKLRKDLVAEIRREKPDILVSCDPNGLYFREDVLNHPDHIAAGKAVIEATYPGAGNPLFFPELLNKGLKPHNVKELWLALPEVPTLILDVTAQWKKKLDALICHRSQVGDKNEFIERMKKRYSPERTIENPKYEEKFRRICFHKNG